MLRPSKHSHPDRTIIGLSLVLLARLRSRRVEGFSSLRGYAKRAVPSSGSLFLPATSLLYLLGLVEYRPKTDAFEYTGDQ